MISDQPPPDGAVPDRRETERVSRPAPPARNPQSESVTAAECRGRSGARGSAPSPNPSRSAATPGRRWPPCSPWDQPKDRPPQEMNGPSSLGGERHAADSKEAGERKEACAGGAVDGAMVTSSVSSETGRPGRVSVVPHLSLTGGTDPQDSYFAAH